MRVLNPAVFRVSDMTEPQLPSFKKMIMEPGYGHKPNTYGLDWYSGYIADRLNGYKSVVETRDSDEAKRRAENMKSSQDYSTGFDVPRENYTFDDRREEETPEGEEIKDTDLVPYSERAIEAAENYTPVDSEDVTKSAKLPSLRKMIAFKKAGHDTSASLAKMLWEPGTKFEPNNLYTPGQMVSDAIDYKSNMDEIANDRKQGEFEDGRDLPTRGVDVPKSAEHMVSPNDQAMIAAEEEKQKLGSAKDYVSEGPTEMEEPTIEIIGESTRIDPKRLHEINEEIATEYGYANN